MLREANRLDTLRRRLQKLGREYLNPELNARIGALARPAVRLVHAPGTSPASGGSRLGGDPVLAAGTPWPRWEDRPLSFLALIDLAEITPLDGIDWLPEKGWLNFFYETETQAAWGFDPGHAGAWRVVHTSVGGIETSPPPGAPVYPAHPLQLRPTLTLPGWEEPVIADLSESEQDALYALDDAWRKPAGLPSPHVWEEPYHQLGGWPGLVQGPFWEEARLAANGIASGTEDQDPRAAALANEAGSLRMLLQLDTDDVLGWQWGDVGRLYYSIHENDLKAADFSKAWMTLQCA